MTFGIELESVNTYTDRTAWFEIEDLESSTQPNATITSSRNSQPFDATGTNLASSSEAWAGSLGSAVVQKMTIARTAAELSLVRARISVGAAGASTLYIDPVITITGQGNNPPTRWVATGAYNAEPAAGGSSGGAIFGGRTIG